MITAGFTLPGFDGVLRAFRTYRPVADSTKPTGWKFVNDGTRLWPDLDGRPVAGRQGADPARPEHAEHLHLHPERPGGGSVVAFTTANAATLAPAHGRPARSPTTLITAVRAQPHRRDHRLDAGDHGRAVARSAAGRRLRLPGRGRHVRRACTRIGARMIFVGANDGMIHAIDARTGYEVWAFIPYNLLPKLRTLRDGQPVEQFDYFVDSSPKIAEVKISGDVAQPAAHRAGPGRHVLPGVRRHRGGHGRRSRRRRPVAR